MNGKNIEQENLRLIWFNILELSILIKIYLELKYNILRWFLAKKTNIMLFIQKQYN